MIFRRPHHRRCLVACLLALLLGVPGIRAAASTGELHPAERVVRELVAEVAEVVNRAGGPGTGDDLVGALVPLLASRTDIALIGRLVLGRHWRSAAPREREAYQALFREFMLRSLAGRLRPHAGASLDAGSAFEVIGTRPAGRADVIVATTLNPPGRPTLHVDWRLRPGAEGYVIIDLIVEGISLLVTQREDFAAVIERGGLPGLLDELRARTSTSI